MEHDKYISALIKLHIGLDRQGPGDAGFSNHIIELLPELPPDPRIADLGCGAGAGALILADRFRCRVKAVDFAQEFLHQLADRARQEGLQDYIEVIEADIGDLRWSQESLDLLWSEGAAYNISFKFALESWRPLLAAKGIAVISEMNYFSDDISRTLQKYMENAYPEIKTEPENVELIKAAGFEMLNMQRLPCEAWWKNYYGPLGDKIARIKHSADELMQAVISDTEEEMEFFEAHQKEYGYTYYIMRAI